MTNCTLEEIDSIKGKYKFYHLLIDGNSDYRNFVDNIEDIYKTELLTILSNMNEIANLNKLPSTKFRPFHVKKHDKAFEFKSKNLRVYGIHEDKTGKIIIFGGYKKNQKKDAVKFESKVKIYLQSKV